MLASSGTPPLPWSPLEGPRGGQPGRAGAALILRPAAARRAGVGGPLKGRSLNQD